MPPSITEGASTQESRIKGVLKEATKDLQNADIPDLLTDKLIPFTNKASDLVPKVAGATPLPNVVDTVGAFALKVPLTAVKFGYSLFPHDRKDSARGPEEFKAALESAGIDLDIEYKELNLDPDATESYKIAALQAKQITFLIEIVGCENLIASDFGKTASDPYVRAKFGSKVLHTTKHQSNCLNPVYTLRKDALFLWSTTMKELFLGDAKGAKGLTLEVCDYDSITSDDVMGTAVVPPKDIYDAHEERLVHDLVKRSVCKNESRGSIAIRIRRATENDETFLAAYQELSNERKAPGRLKQKKEQKRGHTGINATKSIIQTKVKTYVENGTLVKRFKVLPYPNPKVTGDDHLWKTKDEIESETMKPSQTYQSIGSGKIARVFLEILACNDLPNKENVQAFGRNKTDAFVQVVYEDCICRTDVIDDKSNPRFMPWTKRAFVLHSRFPSSVINLGVFDYDAGDGLLHDHDFIGRASVDLSSLRPETEYILDYKLYDTALLETRKENGTIKIRVRMEVDDPRAYLLASLSLPPPRYVNCSAYKDFKCVRQTCYGAHDMNKYSMSTIFDLVEELTSHKRAYYYVVHFVRSMLLWEGSHHFTTFTGEEISLPLNSVCAFAMAVTLVERPYLLPSFSFLTVALVLLSSMRWRNNHPSPWRHRNSFADLFGTLMFGRAASLPPVSIGEEEQAEEAKAFDFTFKELIDAAEKKAQIRAHARAEEEALKQEMEAELEDMADGKVDMESNLLGSKIDNLRVTKKFLYPLQKVLLQVCKWLRFVKNVLLWEEPLSFWLALGCLLLSAAFIKLQVVRRAMWVLGWVTRIATWTIFGPWMKWIGGLIFSAFDDSSEEKEAKRLEKAKEHKEALLRLRVENELAYKLRDFRQYFFGSFLTKVPVLKFDRYIDTPLSSSCAKPWDWKSNKQAGDDVNYRGVMSLPDLQQIPHSDSDSEESDDEKASKIEVVYSNFVSILIFGLLALPLVTAWSILTGPNPILSFTFLDLASFVSRCYIRYLARVVFIDVFCWVSGVFELIGSMILALFADGKYQPSESGQELVGLMIPKLREVTPMKPLSRVVPLAYTSLITLSLVALPFLSTSSTNSLSVENASGLGDSIETAILTTFGSAENLIYVSLYILYGLLLLTWLLSVSYKDQTDTGFDVPTDEEKSSISNTRDINSNGISIEPLSQDVPITQTVFIMIPLIVVPVSVMSSILVDKSSRGFLSLFLQYAVVASLFTAWLLNVSETRPVKHAEKKSETRLNVSCPRENFQAKSSPTLKSFVLSGFLTVTFLSMSMLPVLGFEKKRTISHSVLDHRDHTYGNEETKILELIDETMELDVEMDSLLEDSELEDEMDYFYSEDHFEDELI